MREGGEEVSYWRRGGRGRGGEGGGGEGGEGGDDEVGEGVGGGESGEVKKGASQGEGRGRVEDGETREAFGDLRVELRGEERSAVVVLQRCEMTSQETRQPPHIEQSAALHPCYPLMLASYVECAAAHGPGRREDGGHREEQQELGLA